ncbi:MAG: hypothetical protein Q8S44_05165 [Flavobacteriaceae bacterium]|nr:hypothetical protein [Flavobacteriaceae bacterium]
MTQQNKEFNKISDPITDIRHYIFKIFSNWIWFLITIPIALAYAYYVNISTQRIYGLETVISVKEKQNPLFSGGTNIAFNWGGVSDKVEGIRKILNSRTHNEKVIRKMQFYVDYLEDGRFRMEDVYGKTPFLIELDESQLQIQNTLIKIDFFDKVNYRLTILFPEKNKQTIYNYEQDITDFYQPENEEFTVNAQLGVKLNLPFLNLKLVENPEFIGNPKTYFIKFNAIDGVVSNYQGIRTSAVSGTSLLEISLMGSNKNRLVDYLNTTIEVLAEDEMRDKTNFAYSTRKFIDLQFASASDSLKSLERNIGDFKEQNAIYDLSAEGSSIFAETKGLDKSYQQLNDRLQYFNNLEKYILTSKDFTKIPAPAIINMEDASISSAVSKLTELSVKKEQLTKNVTVTHPSYIAVNQEIETTKNVLLENLTSLKNTIQISVNNINKRIGTYGSKLASLPKKEQKLLNYQRKYELTESNYIFLMQKRYEASIAIAASVSDITVLDKAKDVGQGSSLPRTQFNYLLALLLGALIPIFVIVAIDLIDSKIYTVEEID